MIDFKEKIEQLKKDYKNPEELFFLNYSASKILESKFKYKDIEKDLYELMSNFNNLYKQQDEFNHIIYSVSLIGWNGNNELDLINKNLEYNENVVEGYHYYNDLVLTGELRNNLHKLQDDLIIFLDKDYKEFENKYSESKIYLNELREFIIQKYDLMLNIDTFENKFEQLKKLEDSDIDKCKLYKFVDYNLKEIEEYIKDEEKYHILVKKRI